MNFPARLTFPLKRSPLEDTLGHMPLESESATNLVSDFRAFEASEWPT